MHKRVSYTSISFAVVAMFAMMVKFGDVSAGEDSSQIVNRASVLSILAGRWRSTLDPKSEFIITDEQRVDFYDGEPLSTARISVGDTCGQSTKVSSNKGAYLFDLDSGLCWYVVQITATELSLSYIARGNTLKYVRVD